MTFQRTVCGFALAASLLCHIYICDCSSLRDLIMDEQGCRPVTANKALSQAELRRFVSRATRTESSAMLILPSGTILRKRATASACA